MKRTDTYGLLVCLAIIVWYFAVIEPLTDTRLTCPRPDAYVFPCAPHGSADQ